MIFPTDVCAGLVEACVKQPVSQYVQQQIASCLDIENEFHLGLASHIAEVALRTRAEGRVGIGRRIALVMSGDCAWGIVWCAACGGVCGCVCSDVV